MFLLQETLSLQFSDQWGLGCLVHEIAIGCKVHNAFVHDEPKRQREQVSVSNNSDPPALHHNIMNIDDPAGTPTMSDNLTWHR